MSITLFILENLLNVIAISPETYALSHKVLPYIMLDIKSPINQMFHLFKFACVLISMSIYIKKKYFNEPPLRDFKILLGFS